MLCAAFLMLVVVSGCARSSDDLSVQPVDGKTAAAALSEVRVVIPEVFTFVDGLTRPVDFVGKPDFYMRFDGQRALFEDPAVLAAANPGFAPFREVRCEIPMLAEDENLTRLGLACVGATGVLLSQNSDTFNDEYVPGNTEALVLTADREGTHLFVIAAGT